MEARERRDKERKREIRRKEEEKCKIKKREKKDTNELISITFTISPSITKLMTYTLYHCILFCEKEGGKEEKRRKGYKWINLNYYYHIP
jgi:hypothetical protein